MLVGRAEIANGEHGNSLLLWNIEGMNVSSSVGAFLGQVHHCIITVFDGNVSRLDIFEILFRRVIVQM